MHLSVVLSVVTFVVKYIAATETTNQPSDEASSTTKRPVNENAQSMDMWNANPHLNSLWKYQVKSASFDVLQKDAVEEKRAHRLSVFRPPQSVTRLAKSLSLGVDPYFKKGYFEPFERRPKPVTLIGIRKNGLLPRKTIFAAAEASKSSESEVAVLQSPFNEISSFWLSQPGSSSSSSSSSSSDSELETKDSNEDDKLKQALVLVDLLKSDYLKVLRENEVLRHGSTTTTPNPNEESTCAETSDETNSTTPVNSLQLNWTSPAADPSPGGQLNLLPAVYENEAPAAKLALDGNMAPPLTPLPPIGHRVYIRRMPEYHYGLDGQVLGPISGRRFMNFLQENMSKNQTNFRRNMDLKDPIDLASSPSDNSSLPTPPETAMENTASSMNSNSTTKASPIDFASPSSVNSSLLTLPDTAVTNTTSSINNNSIIKMSSKIFVKATKHAIRKGIIKAAKTTQSDIIKYGSYNENDILEHVNASLHKDPLMGQIASEFAKELHDERHAVRAKYGEANETMSSSMGNAVFNKPWSSMRIHLVRSTRLSIPLNPNNAFCYYHPKNMLCKTAIKK